MWAGSEGVFARLLSIEKAGAKLVCKTDEGESMAGLGKRCTVVGFGGWRMRVGGGAGRAFAVVGGVA